MFYLAGIRYLYCLYQTNKCDTFQLGMYKKKVTQWISSSYLEKLPSSKVHYNYLNCLSKCVTVFFSFLILYMTPDRTNSNVRSIAKDMVFNEYIFIGVTPLNIFQTLSSIYCFFNKSGLSEIHLHSMDQIYIRK